MIQPDCHDRSLIELDFALRGVPWSALGRSVGVVLIALSMGAILPLWALFAAYQWAGVAVGCILCTTIALLVVTPTFRRAMRTRVAVDEGGIRLRQVGTARHIPFSEVKHCAMYPWRKVLANELIAFGADGRELFRIPLMGPSARKEAGRLYRLIHARTKPVPVRHAALQASLSRRDQPTAVWLGRLLDRAKGQAYRSSGELDPSALIEILEDPAYPVDVRSAAAALLLSSSDDRAREAVASALHEGSPPMMHAAVAHVKLLGRHSTGS